MEKKQYIKPRCETVVLRSHVGLLAGSSLYMNKKETVTDDDQVY